MFDIRKWLNFVNVNVYQMKIFLETFDSFQDFKIHKFIQLEFFKLDSSAYRNIIYFLIFKNIDWIWDFRIPLYQEFEKDMSQTKRILYS